MSTPEKIKKTLGLISAYSDLLLENSKFHTILQLCNLIYQTAQGRQNCCDRRTRVPLIIDFPDKLSLISTWVQLFLHTNQSLFFLHHRSTLFPNTWPAGAHTDIPPVTSLSLQAGHTPNRSSIKGSWSLSPHGCSLKIQDILHKDSSSYHFDFRKKQ